MDMLYALFEDLKIVIGSIVIKYEAKENETVDTLKESDRYISAMTQQDSFTTYQSFPKDIIVAAGVTDLELAQKYADNKNSIPYNLRNAVVLKQREYIINNYVEKNDYYRMLNGQPNLTDYDYFYLNIDDAILYQLPSDVPLHELPRESINVLYAKGVIDKFITANPTKKYLEFLGERKIDIVLARKAKKFSILRMNRNVPESFYTQFNNFYDQCREYFMSTLYVKEYARGYDLYDNFMALMIMVMTIQRLISNAFKNGISRDFYDLDSIEMLFNAYNVPFMNNLPLEYQRPLAKNLNNLLRYKATDKVLYDICSILGYERINIYKYFLIKEHVLDVNENPVFIYKEVDNGDGTTSIVEDVEQMYRFYFQAVELRERNVALALSNKTNRLSYEQVTSEDPFWWEDEDLTKTLYESEFNYVESKYLNMNIMYKLTEMLFEGMYAFRMLVDKKSDISTITLELPKIFYNRSVGLFNAVIMLFALLCRKNKLAGNILSTPSKILSVMGFNFNQDFNLLRNFITENKNIIDQKTLDYFTHLTIASPEGVNTLYADIKGLNDFLVDKMAASNNVHEYHAYRKLYKALMVTNGTNDLFKKKDGSTALTYLEYLYDVDEELYSFVTTVEFDKINSFIDYILGVINSLMTDLKFTFLINDSNNVVLDAIVQLIRFFKSYTTDLVSMNIIYLMNSRYYNMIKMISDIKSFEKILGINESLVLNYKDILALQSKLHESDYIALFNQYYYFIRVFLGDLVTNYEGQNFNSSILTIFKNNFLEKISISKSETITSTLLYKVLYNTVSEIVSKEINIKDIAEKLSTHKDFRINQDITVDSICEKIVKNLCIFSENSTTDNDIKITINLLKKFKIFYDENKKYLKELNLNSNLELIYHSISTILKISTNKDKINFEDKIQLIYEV